MQLNKNYKLGNRVKVTEPGHCFQGAVGTVSEPPLALKQEHGWTSFKHTNDVDYTGSVALYWIWFDEPQVSPVSDQFCEAAAIGENHLTCE